MMIARCLMSSRPCVSSFFSSGRLVYIVSFSCLAVSFACSCCSYPSRLSSRALVSFVVSFPFVFARWVSVVLLRLVLRACVRRGCLVPFRAVSARRLCLAGASCLYVMRRSCGACGIPREGWASRSLCLSIACPGDGREMVFVPVPHRPIVRRRGQRGR